MHACVHVQYVFINILYTCLYVITYCMHCIYEGMHLLEFMYRLEKSVLYVLHFFTANSLNFKPFSMHMDQGIWSYIYFI